MIKIVAEFEIVTPMFLSGADTEQSINRIRPPSIKGALRFWWRALQWNAVFHEANPLTTLHERESKLFGNAADEKKGKGYGQSTFSIQIIHGSLNVTERNTVYKDFVGKNQSPRNAIRYLGYGLMVSFDNKEKKEQAGNLYRPCIDSKQKFTVVFKFLKKPDQSFYDALKLWRLLGGLGSRVRRGFGSLTLHRIEEINYKDGVEKKETKYSSEKIKDVVCYKEILKNILVVDSVNNASEYSAFDTNSRVDILYQGSENEDACDVLGHMAKRFVCYRSWGKYNKAYGCSVEQNFTNDKNWFHDTASERSSVFHPERVVFGLPHDYGKHEKDKVNAVHFNRRASPLFFHIHKINNFYIGVSIVFKSIFLPVGEKIQAGDKKINQSINFGIIDDFLDGNIPTLWIRR